MLGWGSKPQKSPLSLDNEVKGFGLPGRAWGRVCVRAPPCHNPAALLGALLQAPGPQDRDGGTQLKPQLKPHQEMFLNYIKWRRGGAVGAGAALPASSRGASPMAATPGVPVPRAELDAGLYGAAGDLNLPHSRTGLEGGTRKGLPGGAPGPINVRVGVMLHLGSLPCPATCCEAAGARGWQRRKTRCRTQRFLLLVHTGSFPISCPWGSPKRCWL